jgi:hypothetical protein
MPPRPCSCDRVTKGQPLAAGECPACWAFWHRPAVNALFGGAGAVPYTPPDYHEVELGLWMGAAVDAPPPGTAAVLNLTEAANGYTVEASRHVPISDDHDAEAPGVRWLREQVEWIAEQRAAGRTVYVHCHGGVSRSGLVTIAYIMATRHISFARALDLVRARRPKANPRFLFMRLLESWERELGTQEIVEDRHPDWPPVSEAKRNDPKQHERHIAGFREQLAGRPPKYNEHEHERGIVWVGGGKYWPGIVVGCRLTRRMGCSLPIEVWYRGESEQVNPADVAGMDVKLIDADALSARLGNNRVPRGDVSRGGWEAKSYALTYSRIRQVLYLDGDAYPVTAACHLFDPLQAAPFAFWSDLPHTSRNLKWQTVWPESPGDVPTVQGGQYLIDRQAFWRELQLWHWLNQRSDYYYGHGFGDQDLWRMVLAATRAPYLHLGAAPWISPAFVIPMQPNGRPAIVHRCQSHLFPGQLPPRAPHLPLEQAVWDTLKELGVA